MTTTVGLIANARGASLKGDEQTRLLNAKAKQAALMDIAVDHKVADVKHSKRAVNKQPDSAQTATKQANSKQSTPEAAQTAAKAAKQPRQRPLYIVYLAELIAEGKSTRKELYDKAVAKFPEVAKSTIQTRITDGFNKKYCAFEHLLTKADNGCISFAKEQK